MCDGPPAIQMRMMEWSLGGLDLPAAAACSSTGSERPPTPRAPTLMNPRRFTGQKSMPGQKEGDMGELQPRNANSLALSQDIARQHKPDVQAKDSAAGGFAQ